MKPLKIASSLSYRVKMRRNLFNRRNSRSTPFRLLYNFRSYSQGSFRLRDGDATGSYPNSTANPRVELPFR